MPAEQKTLRTRTDSSPDPSDTTTRFLKRALTELTVLEREAPGHYHGVLCGLLTAARQETEMLLREEMQAGAWPHSGDQTRLRIR